MLYREPSEVSGAEKGESHHLFVAESSSKAHVLNMKRYSVAHQV